MARTVTPKVAALIERGMQLVRAGDFSEAGRAFERALQQMPELAEVHAMRADALMRAEKLGAAHAAAERALRLRPGWGDALMLRGNIEAMSRRFADAEATFREAIAAAGPAPAVMANLGNVLYEQERFAEALEAYEQAALRGNNSTDLLVRRARTFYSLGRRERAERDWLAVLARQPDSLEALEQLLQIYMGNRDLDRLEEVCTLGSRLAPGDAVFLLGQGFALCRRERHDEAIELYRRAADMAAGTDPRLFHEARLNEAVALLRLGRWREGWASYRWRLDREALRPRYPRLAPEPEMIASAPHPLHLRVHVEQGLGDELLFLRFVPRLRARGHRVSYRTHPKLVALLQGRAELFDAVGPADEVDSSPCDAELLSSDLALASGDGIAPPLRVAAEPTRREAMAARLRAFGPPPYIGITWAGGLSSQEQKHWRDVAIWVKRAPLEELGRILRPLKATIVVLQRKPEAEDAAVFERALGRSALDASDVNDDLREALALLSVLDEYIGVSNTNMHLMAGLEGRTARVLVHPPAEWRWGLSGKETSWFPGFFLYRVGEDRSWVRALADLEQDLSAMR